MRLAPKAAQSFRDDFSYTNSAEAIRRFPFPFAEDQYQYSVNMEPHVLPGPTGSAYQHLIDIDEHYLSEIAERAIVLQENPLRCMAMEHMETACWDMLGRLMTSMATDYPSYFTLTQQGQFWHWQNTLLNIDQHFTFGDSRTLPEPPLEYIGRQVQGDFTLLDQRDNDLFLDAGIITGPADWSLTFDAGMRFSEWHGPVPLAHEMGVFDRALKYLCAIRVNEPVRRLNWTLTINPRLDTSPETYPDWAMDRTTVTPENVAEKVHLRVELQVLDRLARSHALMFSIRTYLISMQDLATNPAWAKRMHRVLKSLPAELIEYKSLSNYYDMLVNWLAQFD